MNEVEKLKVRIFDMGEQMGSMQAALSEIAKLSNFTGDNTKDLIEHIGSITNVEKTAVCEVD